MNKLVFVLGSWGSGTTVVAGILNHLGAYTCPPHFNTNDPRTICSFESVDLRNILLRYINEHEIMLVGRRDLLIQEIQHWLEYISSYKAGKNQLIALKHPLLAVILPDLLKTLQPEIIVVDRPHEDIERSRLRRNWPSIYGAEGAQILNSYTVDGLKEHGIEYLTVPYPELLRSADEYILKIADFCALSTNEQGLQDARKYIRT